MKKLLFVLLITLCGSAYGHGPMPTFTTSDASHVYVSDDSVGFIFSNDTLWFVQGKMYWGTNATAGADSTYATREWVAAQGYAAGGGGQWTEVDAADDTLYWLAPNLDTALVIESDGSGNSVIKAGQEGDGTATTLKIILDSLAISGDNITDFVGTNLSVDGSGVLNASGGFDYLDEASSGDTTYISTAGGNSRIASSTKWRFKDDIYFGTIAAGYLIPKVDGSANQVLTTNGSGAVTWSTPAGSGDVSKVGTPANNQIGVWTGDGSIEGDADLTFDGTDLTTTGSIIANTGISTLNGSSTSGFVRLYEDSDLGTSYIDLLGPATGLTAPYNFRLPINDGNEDEVLTTDGSGQTSWSAGAAGGMTYLSETDNAAITELGASGGNTSIYFTDSTGMAAQWAVRGWFGGVYTNVLRPRNSNAIHLAGNSTDTIFARGLLMNGYSGNETADSIVPSRYWVDSVATANGGGTDDQTLEEVLSEGFDSSPLTIGDNGHTIAINSSDWDIDATGIITNTAIDADNNTITNIGDGAVDNDITINLATLATTVTITDNEAENEANPIVFVADADPDGGNLGLESDGHLTYTPLTGTVTATEFVGGGAGITGVTATEDNDLESDGADGVATTEIFIGNAANAGTWQSLQGEATMSNNGTVTLSHTALDDQYLELDDELAGDNVVDGSIDASELATSAVATAEILDGTILEVDLDADETAANNDILTFDNTGDNFSWQTLAELGIMPLGGGSFTGAVSTNSTFDTVDVAALAAKVHNEDLRHLRFNITEPNSAFDGDADFCIVPVLPAAITVTRIDVTCDADPTTELDFDLMWADAFIGKANAAVIDEMNTTNGATAITSSFDDATVASGKCIYVIFNEEPDEDITQVCVDVTYTID